MTQEELDGKLYCAVWDGDTSRVKKTLEAGANINAIDRDDSTVFMLACRRGHTDIVRLLMEHRADINMVNKYKDTALMKACQHGECADIVKLLIEHCADINAVNKYGTTTGAENRLSKHFLQPGQTLILQILPKLHRLCIRHGLENILGL